MFNQFLSVVEISYQTNYNGKAVPPTRFVKRCYYRKFVSEYRGQVSGTWNVLRKRWWKYHYMCGIVEYVSIKKMVLLAVKIRCEKYVH